MGLYRVVLVHFNVLRFQPGAGYSRAHHCRRFIYDGVSAHAFACLAKINLRDIWMFIGTGIISVVLFNLFYLTTFTLSSLSVAVMLLYTAPVFVMLLSLLLFKERLTFSKILALCSTISGCLFCQALLPAAGNVLRKRL